MASPQKENGFTDVANELMDKVMSLNLSGSEFRVILCVWRQTWGWHKKEDMISLSQLVTKTKLSRKTICEAVSKLVTKRLLLRDQDKYINEYKFNKNYDEWLVTNRLLGSYHSVTKTSYHSVTYKTNKPTITKPTISKDIEQAQEFGNHEINQLIEVFTSKGLTMSKQKLNRYACSRLIKKHGIEKISQAADYALSIQQDRYAPQILCPLDLEEKLAKLVMYKQKNLQTSGGKNYDE